MKTPTYTKEDFIKILASATPQEINKIISERGKEPNKIPLVVFMDN